ncbi:hypothetical protein PTKIN_Ptkin19aG0065200 [Pterospermum kingtungense]
MELMEFSECPGVLEIVEHVLRSCPVAVEVWSRVLPREELLQQSGLDFDSWLRWNLVRPIRSVFAEEWRVSFAIILWWLWRWHNGVVFSDVWHSLEFKIAWIHSQLKDVVRAFNVTSHGMEGIGEYRVRLVGWAKPPVRWVKLNTDGCSKGLDEQAGAGGIFRDTNRDWLKGFMYRIGSCSAFIAELWAVFMGLKIAWEHGYRQLILELDSKLVG